MKKISEEVDALNRTNGEQHQRKERRKVSHYKAPTSARGGG